MYVKAQGRNRVYNFRGIKLFIMAVRKRVCGDSETEKKLEGLAGSDLKRICEPI